MEDPGEDLEVLTRALVQTIQQLADPGSPAQDQKNLLEKTTTGVLIYVRIFRGKIYYRVLPPEKFVVKLYSEHEFLAAEN